MQKVKPYLPEILLFVSLLLLFTFHISSAFSFDFDFGRDLLAMNNILHGKLTLLGPKLSFGGYYVAPYYFYFFSPFLLLSHFLPTGVLLANAIVFALSLTIAFSLIERHTNSLFALLVTLWVAVTPYILFSVQHILPRLTIIY